MAAAGAAAVVFSPFATSSTRVLGPWFTNLGTWILENLRWSSLLLHRISFCINSYIIFGTNEKSKVTALGNLSARPIVRISAVMASERVLSGLD